MHLLIACLTGLASVLHVLDRLGVDLGWFNPRSWSRREKWLKRVHADSAFRLTNPMEAVALSLTATAKIERNVCYEEEQELLRLFEEAIKQAEKDTVAAAPLRSNNIMLGDGEDVSQRPDQVFSFPEKNTATSKRSLLLTC